MQTCFRSPHETVVQGRESNLKSTFSTNTFLRYQNLLSIRGMGVRRCNEMGESKEEGAKAHEEDPESNEHWYVALGTQVRDE